MSQMSHFHGPSSQQMERRTLFQLLDSQTSQHPDKEAIVLYDEDLQRFSLTFREYQEKSQALAVALLEKGLERGDRVGLLSPNNIEFPVVLMALTRIGANVLAIQQGYDACALFETLQAKKCTSVVCHVNVKDSAQTQVVQNLIKKLETECPQFKAVITIGSSADCGTQSVLVHSYSDLLSSGAKVTLSALHAVQSRVQPEDPTLVLFTSGTTSKPKAAQFTHLTLVSAAQVCALGIGVSGTSRVFTDSPFSWCPGMWAGLNFVSCLGATLVSIYSTLIVKKRLWQFALTVLQDEKCTHASVFPYFIHDIVAAGSSLAKYDLSCLQVAITGGQPVPQIAMSKLLTLLPQMKLCFLYGSTEVSAVVKQKLSKKSIDRLPYARLELMEEVEVKITDDEGRVLPIGSGGEILVRGPMVFTEYLENQTATSVAFTSDGWYRTKDMGEMDENGRLKILGRKGDRIRRATETYYPADFESFIAKHCSVAEVIVVGVPDQRLYEEICACVVFKDRHKHDAKLAELESWFEMQCPLNADGLSWKPGHIVSFEKFPRTRTGKPDRLAIRRIAMEKLGIKTEN